MLSRWTNFLTEDGEKQWRQRDEEFELSIASRTELLEKWNAGWAILFEALSSIKEEILSKKYSSGIKVIAFLKLFKDN